MRRLPYLAGAAAAALVLGACGAGEAAPTNGTTNGTTAATGETENEGEVDEPDGNVEAGQWDQLPAAPIDPRRNHAAAWTGDRMIVWGGGGGVDGVHADGAAWDPESQEWRALPESPLSARWMSDAMWTGSELVVWGGNEGPDHLATCHTDGAAYDPVSGTWRALAEAPVDNRCTEAAWTGAELIAWGGNQGGGPPSPDDFHDDGIAYDPAGDTWRMLPAAPIEPRNPDVVTWTGEELLVFGGSGADFETLDDGAAYDPATDTWRAVPEAPLPSDSRYEGVWAGDELIVLHVGDGGAPNQAAAYRPDEDSWRSLEATPNRHAFPALAWTGDVLYVVGGDPDSPDASTFDAYVPAEATWVDQPNPPDTPRLDHTAVWSGSQLLLWGGEARPGDGLAGGAAWTPPSG